jgi:eukaryotic-like serine/threonine-protein kinase
MEDKERLCSRCGARYGGDVIFCPKDGTPLAEKKTEVVDDPYLGILLADQFHIEQLIGIGAMGRVYRAFQKGIERPVAVKIIHRDLLRNPQVMARFVREARVASRLTHPNVVQVLTTGEVPKQNPDVGGEAYLVMEYLDGISLRSALAAAGGAMPLPRALHVVLQVSDAVGEAHAQGIVHRDIKPENVMLVKRGDDPDFVKVLDFGVARIEWADSSVATQAGVIFGTARYISPEGAQGKTVSPPSDVYSIAVILFQCLAGQTPFDGENPVGILIKHTNEPAPDVRSLSRASYVPEPIARVLNANLAKNPSERCRDARALGRALVDAARASGLSPDDLVMRSTLLGSSGRALSLQSLQRTKQHGLTPELGAGASGAGGTAILDEPTAEESDSGRVSRPSSPSSSGRPSRPSGVDPTLSDEPVSELLSRPSSSPAPLSSPTAPGGPSTAISESSPPSARASEPPPSIPDSAWTPGLETPLSPLRRGLMVTACFVLGAGIALFAADRLGAFRSPEPGVESYRGRAEAAMSAGAYEQPPGENVRDITDAALRRWPGAPSIVAVRQSAAKNLVDRATNASGEDPARARRLAQLAVELDPKNDQARELLSALSRPPEPAPSPEPAVSASNKRPIRRGVPRPLESAPSPPESATPPSAPPPGGRWL